MLLGKAEMIDGFEVVGPFTGDMFALKPVIPPNGPMQSACFFLCLFLLTQQFFDHGRDSVIFQVKAWVIRPFYQGIV